jgi:hypothetical protein
LLPQLFVARQLRGGQDEETLPVDLTKAAVMRYSSHCQILLSATARLENEGVAPAEAEAIFPEAITAETRNHRCPVALLLPGASPATATRRVMRRLLANKVEAGVMTQVEENALDFLVAHRAAARVGVSITAAPVSDHSFSMLAQLERMFQAHEVSPKKVRRQLAHLSQAIVNGFTHEELATLLHASSITSFSEFPIGLVTIQPDTSPLCCRTPIAYRPIVPLTRALQFELHPAPLFYLRDSISVICLECIPPDDVVGQLSRVGWKEALREFPSSAHRTFDYVEVDSIENLRRALRARKYDIAVISAHGVYDRRSNRTGFRVGQRDIVLEDELGTVPPLVCLAACQVAPRGSGSVNISDLLFRQGAMGVLGTLVPVDVRRNSHLMFRFFVYIAETLAGRTPLRSIDQVWHFAASSNAVLDVAYGSRRATNLMFETRNGITGIKEFMMRRSVGRLRQGNIYADTEAVLTEMAADRGQGEAFKAWLNNQGYIPESIFYVFLGWPERFVLRDPHLEDARQWYSGA